MTAFYIQTCALLDIGVRGAKVGAIRFWKPLLLAIVVVILYGSVLDGLIREWYFDPNYSHGFLVPIFVCYLVWRKREALFSLGPHPSLSGLFVVLGSLGVLFVGQIGAELFLMRISLVGTIIGLLLYFWGRALLRVLAFPLCFLLLMIPLPGLVHNQIVFPVQLLASRLATAWLEVLRLVPVLREGNILILPNCAIQVVEACSGIRSLISQLALSLGYGYLAERNLVIRALLVLAMIPVAILSNCVRVVGTALLAYYRGPQMAEGFFHLFSGWVIFLLTTILLLRLRAGLASLGRFLQPASRK